MYNAFEFSDRSQTKACLKHATIVGVFSPHQGERVCAHHAAKRAPSPPDHEERNCVSTDVVDRNTKTFTVTIDEKLDKTLNELKVNLGRTSRADVFRLGIGLLKLAAEAKTQGMKMTISDDDDIVRKEILIP
jgi:hypothetical protein